MKKLIIIFCLLLSGCDLSPSEYICVEEATLESVDFITVDDGLIGKDEIHAILRYSNGLVVREYSLGHYDQYQIGGKKCLKKEKVINNPTT